MRKRQKKTLPNSYDLITYKKALPLIKNGEPASKISAAFKITEAAAEDMITTYRAFLMQTTKSAVIYKPDCIDLMAYKKAVPFLKQCYDKRQLAAEMNIGNSTAKEMMHVYSRFVSSI